MKVIIAGSRHIHDMNAVITAISLSHYIIDEVVCGCAEGIDACGREWADAQGPQIKQTLFPADWDSFGKSAGPIRNKKMAAYADALIAVWDMKSPGTKDMIMKMRDAKKPVFVYEVK